MVERRGVGRADASGRAGFAAGAADLAAWARQHWGGRIVGVTGSAGKTTTKDAIAHLLAVGIAGGQDRGQLQ